MEEFDYIVVGLGTAGSVIAARLGEHGHNTIAVIEAGANYLKNPYVNTPNTAAYLWDNPLYPPPFESPPYNPLFDEWNFKTGTLQLYGVPYSCRVPVLKFHSLEQSII